MFPVCGCCLCLHVSLLPLTDGYLVCIIRELRVRVECFYLGLTRGLITARLI